VPVVTQRPLQNEEPAGHAQVPLVHEVPMGQMRPHTPQFALSVLVLVQVPLQFTWPGGHVVVHMRLTQAPPGAQAMLQPPQLRGSEFTSTHEPFAHWVNGAGHTLVQTRFAQTWLAPQVRLQAPQFVGSFTTSTQRPLQSVVPPGQPVHMPLVQVWPALQARLQPPQLFSSVCGSMHWPLHTTSGRPQVEPQLPLLQRSRGPH
jgi:hypothetical protein